jgi:hypothetical protein
MLPTCPCCGSVAVKRRDASARAAACMNPRCPDNGVIKPVHVFRTDAMPQPPRDPRKVALASGGTRCLPVMYE